MDKYKDKDGNQYYVYEYNSILGVWRIDKIDEQGFQETDKRGTDGFIVANQLTVTE